MNYTRNLIQVGLVIALLSLLLFPSIGRSDTVSQSLNLAVSQTPDSFSFVPTDIKGLRKRLGLEPPPPPESREKGKLGIGLSLGLGEYRGDRGGGTVKPGNEFHLEYQWEESPYSLRGGISRGELKDAAFSTKTTSFDLVSLYQLRKIKIKEVTPYLFAGLGWLNFEGKDIYQETLTSGSVVISLGAGIFYPIRDRLKLYLEGGYHFTASDELDWLTEDSNNDGYWRISLGVTHYPPEKSEVRSQESGVRSQKSEEVSADSTPVVVQPTELLLPLVIPQADEGADTAVSQEPAGEAAPMADSDTEAVSPAITEPTPEIVDSVEPPDSLVTPQVDEKPDTTIFRKVEGEAAPTVKPDTGATFPATAEPTPREATEPAKPTIPSATPPPGEEPDKTRDLPPTKPAETSDSPPLQAPQIAGLPKEPGPALPEPMPKQKSLSELTQIQLPFESQLKIDVNLALNAGLGYAQWTKDKDKVNNPPIGFSSGLDFDQTIKAIVKGNIGPKVNVNMDYNPDAGFGKDKTKISISYTGDHDEIVQEAAFGDVSLTLPQTKFINYGNKKVFGLKGQAKYEDFSLIAVGSKTEGTSPPPKPLKGKKAAMETIPTQTENSFQKRKYYRLMAEKTAEERDQLLPVFKDSLEILLGGQDRQFYDDRPDRTTAGEITAGHWENKDSFSGKFYRLIPGEDYLIDHKTGIVTFKRNIYDRDVLAVYFKTRDSQKYGTDSSPVIIKQTTGAGSSITNLYEDYELKNRFFLSSRTEVMYLSSLDLGIEIKDKYGNAYYDVNKNNNKEQNEEYYLKIFGLDKDNDGRIDEDALEYLKDEGLLLFPDPTPFDLTDANSTQNPFYQEHQNDAKWSNEWARLSRRSIYKYIPDNEKVDEPTYSINISYKKKGKTNTYSLDQYGLIEGSVRVFVNKELKNPVKDYQVDYNSGQIIFTNDEDVKENDDILVYYDVGGFGKQETLAGLRGEYKPVENFSLGSTYIFKGASPENKVPKLNETTPQLQVLDMNAEVNAAPGLNRALDLLNLPVANRLSLNAAGEAAASFSTPAAGHDVAIIDSLDGGGGGGATLFLPGEYNWSLGSLPPNDKRAMLLYKDKPYSERPGPYDNDRKDYGHVQILNPDENERETTKYLLALAYNSPEDNRWVSIMRCIKSEGANYSENDYLRAWVKGLEEGEELWIDLGNVSEDADGQGGYQEVVLDERGDTLWNIGEPKTEQRNKNRPKNIFDSEDIGWEFIDEDNDTVTRVGADNYGDKTTPDSEDLDENGKLNTEESYYSFKLESGAPPDARGWVLYQIPRILDTMTKGAPDWTAIKYIRLRLKCKEGKRDPDNPIFIESIEMVKSDWTESDTAGISLSDKHNERNPDYRETYETQLRNDGWFRDMDTDGKDGAMVIEYHLDGNDSSSCFQTIRAGSDKYGNYKNLVFWLYRASGGGASTIFHFQLGSEADDNFFRYSFPLSDSSDDFEELSRQGLINITDIKGESTWNFPREEWRRVIIDFDQLRTLMQNIADSGGFSLGNSSFDYNSGGIVIKGKKPSLKDIKHLKLIVENKSASPASGEIWINEIHLRELSKAVTDPTMAVRFNIKGGFTDWATINWDSNYLGAHFESIGGPAESPQKKVTNNLSGTVGRLKFVPLDCSWSQTKSATDAKRVIDVTGANIDETLAESKTVGFLFTPDQIPGLNPDSRLLKLIPALSKTTYTQADNTTFERTTGEKKGTGSTKTLTGGKISFPLKWMPAINRTGYTRTEGDRLKWDTGRPENTNWSKKMDGEISFPFKNWTSTLLNRAPFLSVIPGQLAGDITFSTTYNKTEQTEYSDTGEEKTNTEEKNLTRNGIFPKYTYSYNYTFPKRLIGIPTGHSLSFGTNHNYGFDYKYQEKGKTVNGVTSDTIDQTDQTVTGSQSFTFKFSPVASLSSNFSLDLSQNYVDSTRRNQGFEAFKHGVNFKFGTNIPFIPDLNPSFNCDGSYDETYSDPRTADPNNRKKDAVNTLTNLTFSTNQINPANWWNKLKVLNGNYTYKLLMKAAYKDMPDTVGLWSDLAHVYKDYYRGRFLPIDGTTDELSGYRNSGSITRNHILTTNWDPGIKRITGCSLTGDSKRIETDSIGTGTTQHNDSLNGSLSLDVLSWVKRFPYRFKDVSSSSVTPSYKWSEDKKFSRQALTSHSISNTPSLEWKLVWPNKLSVTTSINRPKTEDRSTKKTTVTTSYSCAGSHSTTIKKPGVVKIPVFAPMNFKNDINLTSNLGWKRATNETNGVTDASADDYSLTVSGNYNVQTNANGTLKLTGKYHNDRKNSSESYYGLQLFLVFNINFK